MDKLIKKLVQKYDTNCPYEIASYLNINIWFADLGKCTRGMYYRKLNRRYIVIHEQLNEDWKRFVCAHELGHDRLHPETNRFWLDEHTLYHAGKYERQANDFAIRLLTSNDTLNTGETIESFLKRNRVPIEMQEFYMNN